MSYLGLLQHCAPEAIVVVTALVVLFLDLAWLRTEPTRTRMTLAAMFTSFGCVAAFMWMLVVPDQAPKVIDLGYSQFDRFFTLAQQIDFTAEVRRNALAPMVLYLADADRRAQQGYAMLTQRFVDSKTSALMKGLRDKEEIPNRDFWRWELEELEAHGG